MAKPSITNIRPPSSTGSVWTPPKTFWDLNGADASDPNYALNGSVDSGSTGDTIGNFDHLTDQIDYLAMGLTEAEVDHYQYVFLGVNGGENETVIGTTGLRGIIATGNGMDSIVGGNYDDLLFAGNGKDTVAGGGGDDIIFGENGTDLLHGNDGADQISGGNGDDTIFGDAGNDTLYGDAGNDTIAGGADTGTFEHGSEGSVSLLNGVLVYAGAFGEIPGDNNDGGLNNQNEYVDHNAHLNQEGFVVQGGDVLEVYTFSPEDMPVLGVDDGHDFTAVLFDNENGGHTHVLATVSFHLDHESDQYAFTFDVTDHPSGGKVFVYLGTPTDAQLDDPHNDALTNSQPLAALADVATGTGGGTPFELTAGDTITGGAGDDTIVWHTGDGVDLVMDFDQGNTGSFDAVNEHDVLALTLTTGWTAEKMISPDDGNVVIYFTNDGTTPVADSAIELAGVTDLAQVNITHSGNDWQVMGV